MRRAGPRHLRVLHRGEKILLVVLAGGAAAAASSLARRPQGHQSTTNYSDSVIKFLINYRSSQNVSIIFITN